MITDKDLEDLLRQVRLSTTAEQDERILGDALASVDQSAAERQSQPLPTKPLPTATDGVAASTGQSAVFSLRTLARILRRHWRPSTAAACVLVLLAVLPLALPRTEVADSGEADEVAELPENPDPPTRGTEVGHTPHKRLELAGRPKTDAARTRNVFRKGSVTPNARRLARPTKGPTTAVASGDRNRAFGSRSAASRNTALAVQASTAASGAKAGLPGALDAEQTVAKSPLIYKLRLTQVLEDLQGKVFRHNDTAEPEILLEAEVLRVFKGDAKAAGQRVVLAWDTLRGGPRLDSCLHAEQVLPKHATGGEAFYLMALTAAEPATDAEGRPRLKNVLCPDIRGTRVSKAEVDSQQWAVAKNTLERLKLELLSALDDADGNTRHSAIKGLRRWDGQKLSGEPPGGPLWKDERAAARVLAASRDPDWRVRWVVAWMIPKEAGQAGEKALVRLLSDTHRDVRQVAASVLRRRSEEAAGVKRDHQTPAGEAAWGAAVDGVQVRLRAKQSTWNEGAVPRLWADVRNQGKRNLLVRTKFNRGPLEVDGRWYRLSATSMATSRPQPFPPGRQHQNIAVNVHQWWELAASRSASKPRWEPDPARLKLTPGKHTVRVSFTVSAAKNAPGKPFKAVSNPVEIEIVAKSDEKVDATQQGNASATAAEPAVETTGVKPDDRTTAVPPASDPTLDGKEVLNKLKSIDAVYAAAFTASGKRLDWPRKKWKFTMHRGRIALEEEVVEIPKPTGTTKKPTGTTKRLPFGPPQKGQFIAMRSTFYVGPTAQAKYDWVGRIPGYGPLNPWPENGPGPATAGSLNVDDPDAPTYMLQIRQTLWCLGRGYSKYISKIRDVSKQEDGRLKVAADGLDMNLSPGAKWELVIDPDAEYVVRSAELVDRSDRRSSFTNSGLRRYGSHCVPEKGECKGGFINASFEFQSASFEADVEFLRRAKATMQPPYLIHTDVHDQRRTPELYMPYDAGKMSPKGRKPDFDLDWEKEAVFDMQEVPASETKLRAVMGSTFIAFAARKGEIKIRGRQYTALLAQVGGATGSFDRPETVLLLTSADNPKHRIQSYEKHLGSIRTVDGKYYKVSATPTGDKLTVTPCGDNVGVLQVGAGDRDVEKREMWGGVLVSKEGMVPLGNFYYPVPAEDLGQRRIPVGDYAPKILWVDFGNVQLGLQPNGPPAFNIKIRKDKPFTLDFSPKGNLLLTSPRPTQTFKLGSSVPLVAVIFDPQLNLRVWVSDATQKVDKRTYTYALDKKFTVTSCQVSVVPTVVIRDSAGKQVAEGKMPYC